SAHYTRIPAVSSSSCFLFFFNDTATPEIYTLSLHDALPICSREGSRNRRRLKANQTGKKFRVGIKSNISTNRNNLISGDIAFDADRKSGSAGMPRPISYAVFCLKKKKSALDLDSKHTSDIPI